MAKQVKRLASKIARAPGAAVFPWMIVVCATDLGPPPICAMAAKCVGIWQIVREEDVATESVITPMKIKYGAQRIAAIAEMACVTRSMVNIARPTAAVV